MRSLIAALLGSLLYVSAAIAQPSPPGCVSCAVTTQTNVFLSYQVINLNSGTPSSPLSGTALQLVGAAGTTVRVEIDAYANAPRFTCVRTDGTITGNSAVQVGEELCSLNALGHNGTAVAGPQAAIRIYAAQNWTLGANGTYTRLGVTPNGSVTLTDALGLEPDGSITAGTVIGTSSGSGNFNTSGNYLISGSAASVTVNGINCPLKGTCTITAAAVGITYGSTTISGGTGVPYNTTNGGNMTAAALAASSVFITNGSSVPSFSTTLPSGIAATNMALTTPTLGVAAGTSLALGGATIGGNALAVTGTALFNSAVTFGVGPVINGTITGTYSLGGTPSIAGSAINSGTVSGSFMSNVNLAASGNGGVTGTLPVANGGTGQTTATLAIAALLPTPTRAGDIAYWTGTAWATFAGNNSGTLFFSESASGVPAWAPVSGSGTVTSATIAAGSGISVAGTCTITSTGTCTVSGAVPGPSGRITLAANTPVMGPASCGGVPCANQTTLRYDCYVGGGVPYYTGSIDLIDAISSCEVTDAMVSAASAGQVVALNVYDVWWVHSGTNRICLAMSASTGGGGGWAADTGGSNTVRGTGFSQIDRATRSYPTNKNALTNCFNGSTNYGSVSANQATYLGTVYANANGQVSYVFGSAAAGGGAALFGVWNFNRVSVDTVVTDSSTSWTQTGTGPIRPVHSSTNNSVSFVSGLPEDGAGASYIVELETNATAGSGAVVGFAMDSTSVFDYRGVSETVTAANAFYSPVVTAAYSPVSGFHFIQALESNTNGLGTTYFGLSSQGLTVSLRN